MPYVPPDTRSEPGRPARPVRAAAAQVLVMLTPAHGGGRKVTLGFVGAPRAVLGRAKPSDPKYAECLVKKWQGVCSSARGAGDGEVQVGCGWGGFFGPRGFLPPRVGC